jgi:hypothetical protein
MSYDLSFCVARGTRAPTKEQFAEHFRQHALYEVSDGAAHYANEETGSVFAFYWGEAEDDDELAAAGLEPTGLSFELNYARPHGFALEARIELEHLVKQFELSVSDPQFEGMGTGAWDGDAFLRGWRAGNEAAVSVLLAQLYDSGGSATSLALLPEADIGNYWRWNYVREGLEAELGILVPRVFFFRDDDGKVLSLVSWPDAAPVALPGVDCALLHDSEANKSVLVAMEELAPALDQGTWGQRPVRHLILDAEEPLALVADVLEQRPARTEPLDGVHPGGIAEVELVMRCLQALRDVSED